MSDSNSGGAGNQQTGGKADDNNQGKGTVSYETYSRVIDEVKGLKDKIKEFTDRENQNKEKLLKDQNDWKALAEEKERQLKEEREKRESLESSITDSIKLNAFQKHLGGKLRADEYFDFVPTDKIVYNPETKKVDEESVKGVVQDFLKKHSHLVDFGKKGSLPNKAANGTGGKVPEEKSIEQMTADELAKHIIDQAEKGLVK